MFYRILSYNCIFSVFVLQLISTAITLSLTDKHGRRFFLVLGCLLMSGALAVVGISTVVRPHDIPKVCERNLSEIVYRHPAELDNAEREATASPVTSSIINGTLSWKTVISSSPTLSPSSASSLPVVTTMDGAHVAQLVVNFLALIVFMVGYAIGFGPSKQKNPISSHRSDSINPLIDWFMVRLIDR